MPSSGGSQSETYSSYKHHNTAKSLIGIAPSGMITFVSDLYAGRLSGRTITKDCGILKLLEDGDSVMADNGFDIIRDMPKNTALNIPPFLKDHSSLTIEEETETRRIAAVRVHVERAIRRIKVFKILKTVFPISMAANLNNIWIVVKTSLAKIGVAQLSSLEPFTRGLFLVLLISLIKSDFANCKSLNFTATLELNFLPGMFHFCRNCVQVVFSGMYDNPWFE